MPQELQGLKIARAVRVSTAIQTDNWSTVEQDKYFDQKLEAMGATIVPFDEQATSGRDLSKRKVLKTILGLIDTGQVDGVAYYDVKRLTRNELGTDGGIIARHLIDARAIFVTNDRVYRLWQDSDIMAFQFECMISGIDIRNIRRTLWRGIMARADTEPFFMGKPPIGYTTQVVEEKRGGKTQLRRTPIKDPAQVELMDALTKALDESLTIGEVVHRMNTSGFKPKRRTTDEEWSWRIFIVRLILNNPIYVGKPKFGRLAALTATGHKRSPVWEDHKDKRLEYGGPEATAHLAYWAPSRVNGWKAKFAVKQRVGMRSRKHVRPLVGILSCASCGRPMTSLGSLGYGCQTQHNGECPEPQHIRQHVALRDLSMILPDIWIETKKLLEEAQAMAQDNTRVSDLESEISTLKEQQEIDTQEWMKMRVKPAFLTQALQDREQQITQLEDKLEEARSESSGQHELTAAAELLAQDPQRVMAHLGEEQQARMYRLLVEDVVINCRGRRFHVVDSITFTPRFGPRAGERRTVTFDSSNKVSETTCSGTYQNKLSIEPLVRVLGAFWKEVPNASA